MIKDDIYIILKEKRVKVHGMSLSMDSSFFFFSRMMPERAYISVLLPALFEPKIPMIFPSGASMLTLFSAIMFS